MIHFSKYHGCGNDFIIIGEAELARAGAGGASAGGGVAEVAGGSLDCGGAHGLSDFARRICHRQLGVGADGLIVVRTNPLAMDIINSDGSVAPMCGNGIRCFARHCLETGVVPVGTESFDVSTLAGVMRVSVSFAGGFAAEVCMGKPDWSARAAGIDEDGEYIGRTLNVADAGTGAEPDVGASEIGTGAGSGLAGKFVKLSSLFLGTYHTVVWLDENEWICGAANAAESHAGSPLTDSCGGAGHGGAKEPGGGLYGHPNIARLGSVIETHPVFTNRTNVNFARVIDRNTVEMITWERGAGMTAACGTGASSVVALGLREGRLGSDTPEAKVLLPHGELHIRQGAGGEIFMCGPAEHVFDGEYYG
ncbi:MAG: diaminopimelate epimerase [Clostridiales Family XIII bacterium]|jgi:diaminopimelate epimerase|nr:diaminopimelate epimerase [Clostridiales Family XIII bacterium]